MRRHRCIRRYHSGYIGKEELKGSYRGVKGELKGQMICKLRRDREEELKGSYRGVKGGLKGQYLRDNS